MYCLCRNYTFECYLCVDVCDTYNALDKGQQLLTYVPHCLCIYILLPFIENRCLEYQVIEKTHHVAHNETVGILSKKPRKKV